MTDPEEYPSVNPDDSSFNEQLYTARFSALLREEHETLLAVALRHGLVLHHVAYVESTVRVLAKEPEREARAHATSSTKNHVANRQLALRESKARLRPGRPRPTPDRVTYEDKVLVAKNRAVAKNLIKPSSWSADDAIPEPGDLALLDLLSPVPTLHIISSNDEADLSTLRLKAFLLAHDQTPLALVDLSGDSDALITSDAQSSVFLLSVARRPFTLIDKRELYDHANWPWRTAVEAQTMGLIVGHDYLPHGLPAIGLGKLIKYALIKVGCLWSHFSNF